MLMCDKCGKEIKPGDKVNMGGGEEGQRIFVSDELIITHEECPEEVSDAAAD